MLKETQIIIESILNNKNILSFVAKRSYFHILGFKKIILKDFGRFGKIRLNYWPEDSFCAEDIHDHYWDFRSILLKGSVSSEEFIEHKISREPELHHKYQMMPIGNGEYQLKFVDNVKLEQIRSSFMKCGGSYAVSSKTLHRTEVHEETMTLFLQGGNFAKSNHVYKTGAVLNNINSNINYMSEKQVVDVLQRAIVLMGG